MPINGDGNGGSGPPGIKRPMKKSTRNWLIIGAVAVGGVVIWWATRSRSAQQTAGSTDGAIDPSTGIPYSQEYSGFGAQGTTPSLYGYVDPSTGAFISGVGAGATGVVTAPSTNASWAQQVESYLQNLGYDPVATAAAIGKYLTGQTLTSDQSGIVSAAQGFFGPPPQGAPVISVTPPSGNGSGGGSTGFSSFKTLTASKNETFAQFAREHNWGPKLIAAVEKINHLSPSSRLHKGERIIRPWPWGSATPTTTPMQ